MNKKLKLSILLVLTMLVVALVTVLAKPTLARVDSFTFVWLQMLFGALAIIGYTFVVKKQTIPKKIPAKAWVIMILIGICNFTIVKTLFIFSLEKLPVTTHAYIVNFVGIVTMLFSSLWLKEPPRLLQIFGVLIALLGINYYFEVSLPEAQLFGVFLAVVLVIFLAATNILIRLLPLKYSTSLPPNVVSSIAIFTGGVPLILFGLFRLKFITEISLWDWCIIGANGFIAIALTMNVFNQVIHQLKAYEASVLASTGLIFTAIYSFILLGEQISNNQLVGIALLLIGILVVQYFSHTKAAAKE